jgi:hypothetical protein
VFVNHLPNWQPSFEYERELQTVVATRHIEAMVSAAPRRVMLTGDRDAAPDAASIRFWTGRQSLAGIRVCCRDARDSSHLTKSSVNSTTGISASSLASATT